MKRPAFLTLLLCTSFVMATDKSRNVGSITTLDGHIHSIRVFLSDAQTDWTDAEKKDMIRLSEEAETWLSQQAQQHDRKLKFSSDIFGLHKDIEIDHQPDGVRSGLEDVYLMNKLIPYIGYTDQEALIRAYKKKYNNDHICVLFYFKKDGASYAFPYEEGLDSQFFLEGMAIYHRFSPDIPQCASCIAHEMLHLAGAWDYYQTFMTTAEQEAQARKDFPNSIMLRTSYSIEELEIDPITAWRIGWGDVKPAKTSFYDPIR